MTVNFKGKGLNSFPYFMKKILVLLPLLMATLISIAQQAPVQKDRAYFLQKSKNQRTAAWILTGAGAAMAIGGGIGFNENFNLFGPGGETEAGIMVAGGLMVAAGVALHIIATKNKEKADLAITTVPFQRPGYDAWAQKKMLALQWKIPLRKQASQKSYFAN